MNQKQELTSAKTHREEWGFVLLFSILPLLAVELSKLIIRSVRKKLNRASANDVNQPYKVWQK